MSDDDKLRDLLRSEIPDSKPGYWEAIEARLEQIETEEVATNPSDTPPLRAVADAPSIAPPPAEDAVGSADPVENDLVRLDDRRNVGPRSRYLLTVAAAVAALAVTGGMLLTLNGNSSTTSGPAATSGEPVPSTGPETTEDGPDTTPPTSSEDDDVVADTTETTVDEPTSSGPTSEPATQAPADDGTIANQAEPGLRFDYGEIVQSFEVDGVGWIRFDRHSFGPDQLQGPSLQDEPRSELATDHHGGSNANPRLRTYPLAADVVVLLIEPATIAATCSGEGSDGDQDVFVDTDLGRFLGMNGRLSSLTFNADGQVIQIRDQRTC